MTSSIAAWLAGTRTNNGWIVLPTGGNNGVDLQFSTNVNSPYLDVPTATPPRTPPPPSPPMLPPFGMLEFNSQTANVSGGCQSATISTDNPNRNQGPLAAPGAAPSSELLSWDGASITGHRDYVVLQFTNLFGTASHQIHPHDIVTAAKFRYLITDDGDQASVHEILHPWNANTVTLNSFAGSRGLTVGDDYRAEVIATAPGTSGWKEIDVTASILRWLGTNPSGTSNNGWIFVPTGGNNGAQIRSCTSSASQRPYLQVYYQQAPPAPPSPPSRPPSPPRPPPKPPPPPPPPLDAIILSGPSVSRSTWIRSTQNATAQAPAADNVIWWDGNSLDETDRDYVLLWFDISGIPAGRFQAATLRYVIGGSTDSPGNMGELHDLRVPWSMSTSYSSLPYVPTNITGGSSSTYGAADHNMPCSLGPHSVDVTNNVRAWLSGTPNYGWIVVPTFSNGCGMQSHLSTTGDAPQLIVSLVAPSPPPALPGASYVAAIRATFTVAGDVSSFNENAFKNRLATQMNVSPSVIRLVVYSASVGVQATITYPSPAAASAAATTLAATPPAALTAALGVTVLTVTNVAPTVIVVAPPPPPFNSGSGAGVSQGVVIGVAVGVTAFVLLVAIIVCTFKLRQKKATTIVKAIPTTTINNPIAQSSATSGVEMKDAI